MATLNTGNSASPVLTTASAAFLDDLRATYDSGIAVEARGEELAVRELEGRWLALKDAAFKDEREYGELLETLGNGLARDPASKLQIDLLGLVGRARDEVVHTRVIGNLLGRPGLLGSFLRAAGVREVLSEEALSGAVIEPEKGRNFGGKWIIPDLVVALKNGDRRTLVVIENKIGIRDREGQLDDYRAWAKGEGADALVLVYLTPKGDAPSAAKDADSWRTMSYVALVETWRAELTTMEQRTDDSSWAEVLRLYLATILRHVLARQLPARTRGEKLLLIPYLRQATAGKGL